MNLLYKRSLVNNIIYIKPFIENWEISSSNELSEKKVKFYYYNYYMYSNHIRFIINHLKE